MASDLVMLGSGNRTKELTGDEPGDELADGTAGPEEMAAATGATAPRGNVKGRGR